GVCERGRGVAGRVTFETPPNAQLLQSGGSSGAGADAFIGQRPTFTLYWKMPGASSQRSVTSLPQESPAIGAGSRNLFSPCPAPGPTWVMLSQYMSLLVADGGLVLPFLAIAMARQQ